MADILLDNQAVANTPASGKSILAVDSTTKKFYQLDDAGRANGILSSNDLTASNAIATADTYVTNSDLLIPSFGMKVGQQYRWEFTITKTAAGTAAFVLNVRIGSLRTTSDASRLALTQAIAQAATASSCIMVVTLSVRAVGVATGVIAGGFAFSSVSAFGDGKDGVSSTFDNSALGGQYVGLSFTTGASAAWTINMGAARLLG